MPHPRQVTVASPYRNGSMRYEPQKRDDSGIDPQERDGHERTGELRLPVYLGID